MSVTTLEEVFINVAKVSARAPSYSYLDPF